MCLISISWTIFKSPGQWDQFDEDYLLGKGDQSFKYIDKCWCLGIKDLPEQFKTGKIIAEVYLLSTAEIVNGVQQIGTGTLLTVINHILDLIWGTDAMYLFDRNSKEENGKLSSSDRAVIL